MSFCDVCFDPLLFSHSKNGAPFLINQEWLIVDLMLDILGGSFHWENLAVIIFIFLGGRGASGWSDSKGGEYPTSCLGR